MKSTCERRRLATSRKKSEERTPQDPRLFPRPRLHHSPKHHSELPLEPLLPLLRQLRPRFGTERLPIRRRRKALSLELLELDSITNARSHDVPEAWTDGEDVGDGFDATCVEVGEEGNGDLNESFWGARVSEVVVDGCEGLTFEGCWRVEVRRECSEPGSLLTKPVVESRDEVEVLRSRVQRGVREGETRAHVFGDLAVVRPRVQEILPFNTICGG